MSGVVEVEWANRRIEFGDKPFEDDAKLKAVCEGNFDVKLVKARDLDVQDNPLVMRLKEIVTKERTLLRTWEGMIDKVKALSDGIIIQKRQIVEVKMK